MTPSVAALQLPRKRWVSLCSALTWLEFDHAFELPDLLQWAAADGLSAEDISNGLTRVWQELADHSWVKDLQVRALRGGQLPEVTLTSDELRTASHVTWRGEPSPTFQLLSHPPTFQNAFLARARGYDQVFEKPVIWRQDVIQFKKVRPRARTSKPPSDYEGAARYFREKLSCAVRQPGGLKRKHVAHAVEEYHLAKYQADQLWTEIAKSLNFQPRGRPRKHTNKNADQN